MLRTWPPDAGSLIRMIEPNGARRSDAVGRALTLELGDERLDGLAGSGMSPERIVACLVGFVRDAAIRRRAVVGTCCRPTRVRWEGRDERLTSVDWVAIGERRRRARQSRGGRGMGRPGPSIGLALSWQVAVLLVASCG